MSGVWGSAIWYWDPPLPPVQSRIALSMPIIYGIIATIAFIVHLRLYMKALSERQESQVEGGYAVRANDRIRRDPISARGVAATITGFDSASGASRCAR